MQKRVGLFMSLGVLALAGGLAASRVDAALGDRVEPAAKEAAALHQEGGTPKPFTVRTTQPHGMDMREYIRDDGIVFAVTWQGRRHPDLRPMLGRYADAYESASQAAAKPRGRQPIGVIRGEDIVVEKFGHTRAVRGRAFAPSLLPKGVDPDALP